MKTLNKRMLFASLAVGMCLGISSMAVANTPIGVGARDALAELSSQAPADPAVTRVTDLGSLEDRVSGKVSVENLLQADAALSFMSRAQLNDPSFVSGSESLSRRETAVQMVWSPSSSNQQFKDLQAGIEVAALEPTFRPMEDAKFVSESWRGVEVSSEKLRAVVFGHYEYLVDGKWNVLPSSYYEVVAVMDPATNAWLLDSVNTRQEGGF